MPIAPCTMFMDLGGLEVRYRASAEPQRLEVGMTFKRKGVDSIARVSMGHLVEAIEAGAAGGADFPPAVSSAKLIKGTFDPKKPGLAGPSFAWTLEVRGISPPFLRVVIDQMAATGGMGNDVTRFSIVGSLPPGGDPLSVDTATMIAWLDDFGAFPGCWPNLPFALRHVSTARGASATIELANDATPALAEAIEELVSHWGSTRTTMPNAAHKKGLTGVADIAPKLTRKKRTVTVKWKAFDYDPGPPFDVLTNMLGKFHGTVSPIVSVEYAHP